MCIRDRALGVSRISLANYGEFCLAENRLEDARKHLEQSWTLQKKGAWQGHLLFCAALYCLRSIEPSNEAKQLRRIAWGLKRGMRDPGTRFEALLKKLAPYLTDADSRFYGNLARVIQGRPLPIDALSKSAKWRRIKPEKPLGALI